MEEDGRADRAASPSESFPARPARGLCNSFKWPGNFSIMNGAVALFSIHYLRVLSANLFRQQTSGGQRIRTLARPLCSGVGFRRGVLALSAKVAAISQRQSHASFEGAKRILFESQNQFRCPSITRLTIFIAHFMLIFQSPLAFRSHFDGTCSYGTLLVSK